MIASPEVRAGPAGGQAAGTERPRSYPRTLRDGYETMRRPTHGCPLPALNRRWHRREPDLGERGLAAPRRAPRSAALTNRARSPRCHRPWPSLDPDPVSWTPDYAGDRVGRSPSWVVRASARTSSVRTHSSWCAPLDRSTDRASSRTRRSARRHPRARSRRDGPRSIEPRRGTRRPRRAARTAIGLGRVAEVELRDRGVDLGDGDPNGRSSANLGAGPPGPQAG